VLLLIIPLIWFVLSVDVGRVLAYLTRLDVSPGPVGGALVLLLTGYALHAMRWRWLLAGKSRYLDTFHAANIGHLVNLGVPAGPATWPGWWCWDTDSRYR
jgi:hypothetical protein